jgi:hypothetical protein
MFLRLLNILITSNIYLVRLTDISPFQGNFNPRVYDKRDEFSFLFVNFPFWNVSLVPSYGVYVSQLDFYIYL